MSRIDSLAGLDSMILHINTHSNPSPTFSTSVSLDGESYVLVPRRKRKFERAGRAPLANKTNNINSPVLHSETLYKPDISISIYQDSINESIDSVHGNRDTLPNPHSFKPLPPVVASSPLRASFLDLSIPPTSPLLESHSELLAPIFPSTLFPPRSRTELPSARSTSSKRSRKAHSEAFLIPAFQHPNSPYVPWTPPVRRRIIRPDSATSGVSSHYSRPFSRSGARAPEPACTPEPEVRLAAKKGWGLLKQTLSRRVSSVVNRIGTFKQPSAAQKSDVYLPAITPRVNHARSVSEEDNLFAANYSPSPLSPLVVLSARRVLTPSLASLASSDSATLTRWLAARQEDQRDYEPGSMMSMEEYETRGSWLDLSGDKKRNGEWLCGVPGCQVHAGHMSMHAGQVTTLDFSPVTENFDVPTTPVQHRSSPEIQTLTSRLSSGQKGSAPSPLRGDSSVAAASPHRREMSMPGGWTF